MNNKDYCGVGEAARILSVSPDAVRWMNKEGKIDAIRVGKKRDRKFLLKDVYSLKERRENPEYIEQKIICAHCSNIIKINKKIKRPNTFLKKKTAKVCDKCIKKQRTKCSKRMQKNNPMKDPKVALKVSKVQKEKHKSGELKPPKVSKEARDRGKEKAKKFWKSEEGKKHRTECSKRMQKNNPMKDPKVASKMGKTLKKNHADGKYNWPKGPDHWLWKGRRGFFSFVRSRLYRSWTLEIFKRDDFTCTKCKKTNCELHAHHIKPFIDIARKILKKEKIEEKKLNEIQNKWEYLSELIIKEHELKDGITVCVECHGIVDPRYRRYKGKGKGKK